MATSRKPAIATATVTHTDQRRAEANAPTRPPRAAAARIEIRKPNPLKYRKYTKPVVPAVTPAKTSCAYSTSPILTRRACCGLCCELRFFFPLAFGGFGLRDRK